MTAAAPRAPWLVTAGYISETRIAARVALAQMSSSIRSSAMNSALSTWLAGSVTVSHASTLRSAGTSAHPGPSSTPTISGEKIVTPRASGSATDRTTARVRRSASR